MGNTKDNENDIDNENNNYYFEDHNDSNTNYRDNNNSENHKIYKIMSIMVIKVYMKCDGITNDKGNITTIFISPDTTVIDNFNGRNIIIESYL